MMTSPPAASRGPISSHSDTDAGRRAVEQQRSSLLSCHFSIGFCVAVSATEQGVCCGHSTHCPSIVPLQVKGPIWLNWSNRPKASPGSGARQDLCALQEQLSKSLLPAWHCLEMRFLRFRQVPRTAGLVQGLRNGAQTV